MKSVARMNKFSYSIANKFTWDLNGDREWRWNKGELHSLKITTLIDCSIFFFIFLYFLCVCISSSSFQRISLFYSIQQRLQVVWLCMNWVCVSVVQFLLDFSFIFSTFQLFLICDFKNSIMQLIILIDQILPPFFYEKYSSKKCLLC